MRCLKVLLSLILAIVPLSCVPVTEKETENSPWWHDAVFYQIWPRSFQDSDGDGIGDFKGITSRLDYLADLGITAIWLTPMFEAPSYHGYDFQEFYEVEADYGTMEDFEELLVKTEKRGIKVIADLVLNHISTENDWFKKSVQKIEPYSDYFVWSPEIPEGPWGKPWATPEHPEMGYNKPESVWFKNEDRGEYYYAVFDRSQPDLNLGNADVVEELKRLTKFWVDKGFDGFRLDAIRYAFESGPFPDQADTQETIDFWVNYNDYIKNNLGADVMLIGEVWASTDIIAGYYSDGSGIDLCFDFNFGNQVMNALKSQVSDEGAFGYSGSVEGAKTLALAMKENFQAKSKQAAPVSFYSPFLTNHDQNRVMYNLGNDLVKMKMAAVLLLTGVGTPFIYYGEEIGLSQNQVGDDIFKRAPMQWDSSDYAGFTTNGTVVWVDDGKWVPWRQDHQPWWKPMWDSFEDKTARSVEGQRDDPNSLLNLYKNLIRIRKVNPEFKSVKDTSVKFLDLEANVCAFKRIAENGETSIVVMNGSSYEPNDVAIEELKGKAVTNLLTDEQITFDEGIVKLPGGGFYILKIQ